MRVAPRIELQPDERATLESWARGRAVPYRLVLRARMILRAAEGRQNRDIAAELKTTPTVVSRWRRRFLQKRIAGIEKDAPRGCPSGALKKRELILQTTRNEKPPDGDRWSTRKLAQRLGLSHATVQRVWKSAGLTG